MKYFCVVNTMKKEQIISCFFWNRFYFRARLENKITNPWKLQCKRNKIFSDLFVLDEYKNEMCALRKEIAKKHLHNKYSVITREARRAVSQNPEYATLREHGHTFDKPWVRSLKREFGPKIDLDTMTGKFALKLLKRSKMFGITRVKSKDIKKHILKEYKSRNLCPHQYLTLSFETETSL